MLRRLKKLLDATIAATDGDIGNASDVLFADRGWPVRYLVVDTGSWTGGGEVLLSPQALDTPDVSGTSIPVRLSREAVRASPPLDSDQPVSRRYETKLHQHYQWVAYWGEGTMVAPPSPETVGGEEEEEGEVHLRSGRELRDYVVEGVDGEIGRVVDFLIDVEDWVVRYIVVAAAPSDGEEVLLDVGSIERVSWRDERIHAVVSRGEAQARPAAPTPPDEIVDVLNGLVETAKDREARFFLASEHVPNDEVRRILHEGSLQRKHFASELRLEVERLGAPAEASGSVGAALRRGLLGMRAAITGDDTRLELRECASGERDALARYDEALEQGLPAPIEALVAAQRQRTSETHQLLAELEHTCAELDDDDDDVRSSEAPRDDRST